MAHKRLTSTQRRAQIIAASTRLFAKYGYKKVTMKMLADSCRVTEPALYRYFRSKKDLYNAVLLSLKTRLDLDSFLAELNQKDNIEDVLFGLARYIVRHYSKNTELSRLLLFSALEGHPLARQTFEDLRGMFVSFLSGKLRALIEEKKIKKVHPVITARCFIGMVMDCSLGLHLWRNFQGRSYEPERILKNNVPIYVAGLTR